MSDALKSQCIKGFERASGHPPENTTIAPKRTLQRAAYPIPGACFAFWGAPAIFSSIFFRPASFLFPIYLIPSSRPTKAIQGAEKRASAWTCPGVPARTGGSPILSSHEQAATGCTSEDTTGEHAV